MGAKEETTANTLVAKLIGACDALIALPALLTRMCEGQEKVIYLRNELTKDADATDTPAEATEVAADKKPAKGAKPAAKAAEPEPPAEEEEEDLELPEEEEEELPAATRKDIVKFIREETGEGKPADHVTKVKAAFAVVRRELIGEVDGKPAPLDNLDAANAPKFLAELKRKIKAL